MLIPCPHCGPREVSEFTYGGDATRSRPAPTAPEAEWCAYVYARENPRGAHREFWQHTGGCRAIFVVTRDVTTHEIVAGAPAAPDAADAAARRPLPDYAE